MIVIKLNIVRLDHFVSLDHDHTTQWLSVFCTSRTSFFFSVASKNAWRRTLDSKTQTKERKWVSFELLKFILGSGAEGNKTGTRKRTRNLWFPEIESVMILHFYSMDPKRRWSRFEPERICYQAIFFRRKSADASQTKREEGPADRRLNQNLPRLRWSRRESM